MAEKKKRSSPTKKPEKSNAKKGIGPGAEKKADREEKGFPIVGIGASAGGLQALEAFFAELPAGCDMAFVIVQHLDPHHESLMNSLLSRETPLGVNDIRDGIPVETNQVYIKPPGKDVVIENRTLYLREVKEKGALHFPIDTFFRSLADDQKERAICIILSGAGTDGTLGAKRIKGEGGMVIVQEERQAQYPRMPKSVIDEGVADIILPVEKMPEHLSQLINHPFMVPKLLAYPTKALENDIQGILMLVRTQTGHDFSQYKRNTIVRRIQRRMALSYLNEMKDYRRYLRQNAREVNELFKDLTINVTSFFRDNDAFLALVEKGIKPLMEKKQAGSRFRVWVPGCSSGEEAYSLAILLVETAAQMEKYFDFQIFGTDISPDAIETARSGDFPESIKTDISAERLKQFFIKKRNRYQVDSKIRDLMVFAVHDLIRDPPFSNMELTTCRNLLIYMNTDLQKRVFPILHYALNSEGILFLGISETFGGAGRLFEPIDTKNKIYRRKDATVEPLHQLRIPPLPRQGEAQPEISPGKTQKVPRAPQKADVRTMVERAIAEKYAPPAVLIDEGFDILYFHGETGRYLSLPKGEASLNIFNLVQGELHFRLSQALEKVKLNKEPVRIDRVQVRHNHEFLSLGLLCTPLTAKDKKDKSLYLLVEFQEHPPNEPNDERRTAGDDDQKSPAVNAYAQELRITRQELQATIEELETTNEELTSSNEELQANNEELQSTNEELESSKEELQSTNEELETVNAELSKKNQDLMKVEDDLDNLFASTEIGTIFLDKELHIKRFTHEAKAVFNLSEERDIGRHLRDITSSLKYDRFTQDAEEVLEKLTRKEIKLQDQSGLWYVLRIVPYRTRKNVIGGVILTFVDVVRYESSELYSRDAKSFFYKTLSALWEPILILDKSFKVFTANRAFLRTFKTTPRETENRSIFELGDSQWDIPGLRKFLEEIIPDDSEFEGYEVEHDFPVIGQRKMSLNARKIKQGDERPAMILLSFRDITNDQ